MTTAEDEEEGNASEQMSDAQEVTKETRSVNGVRDALWKLISNLRSKQTNGLNESKLDEEGGNDQGNASKPDAPKQVSGTQDKPEQTSSDNCFCDSLRKLFSNLRSQQKNDLNASKPELKFWAGKDIWDDSLGSKHRVRKFENEEEKSRMEKIVSRLDVIIYDWIFFIILLVIGIVLLVVGNHGVDKIRGQMSSMLFTGGFIPGVTLVVYEVLPRLMSMCEPIKKCLPKRLQAENKFGPGDGLSLMLSVVFVLVAVLMNLDPGKSETSWLVKVGISFADTGLISMIRRFFFLYEDSNDVKRRFKKEIEDLQQSAAIGIADGYYCNFLKEVCEIIKGYKETKMRVTYDDGKEEEMKISKILVFLPRDLNLTEKNPIESFITNVKDLKGGKLPKLPENTSRGKFVKFHARGNQRSVAVDIPTGLFPLVALVNLGVVGNKKEEWYRKEVGIVSNRLSWWLEKQNLSEFAQIVEVQGDGSDLDQPIKELA